MSVLLALTSDQKSFQNDEDSRILGPHTQRFIVPQLAHAFCILVIIIIDEITIQYLYSSTRVPLAARTASSHICLVKLFVAPLCTRTTPCAPAQTAVGGRVGVDQDAYRG